MIKTESRKKNFLFSTDLSYLSLYKVENLKKINKNIELKIGILDNSFEAEYVNLYFSKNIIKNYPNYKLLMNGLNKGEVDVIYTLNIENVNSNNFFIKEGKFPKVFGFNKKDELLKDIINKALSFSSDLDELLKEGSINRDYILHRENLKKNTQIFFTNILVYILLTILVLSILKIYYQYKSSKELLKDKLTRLPNIFKYFRDLEKYDSQDCTLIKIKLEMLAEINQILGWEVGNKIILDTLKILVETFSKNTPIYKVSGNNFYIISTDENVDEKINRIKNEILALNFEEVYGFKTNVKINYYTKNSSTKANKVFEYLEIIENDKNIGVCIIKLNENSIKNLIRKNKIKQLFIKNEFSGLYPVFQPKFNIRTKKMVGAEALARLDNDELGTIYPNEFIEIAERAKKVHLIDYKIAEETLKFLNNIPKKYLEKKDFKVSFNISLQTFEREDFIYIMDKLLKNYEVNTSFIEIELTESILGLNLSEIIKKIENLKSRGIQISIDDFTAGNSSVSLLSILPIDVIKFDKSILDLVTTNTTASNIYIGLINMIKTSNFKIVVEGIESEGQLKFLLDNGIEIGQGYIFSKPIPEKDFFKLNKWNYKK